MLWSYLAPICEYGMLVLAGAGLPDELISEEGEAAADRLGVDEPHGFLLAALAEEALAGPEHDREDDQPHLVDQVVVDERAPELIARGDDDFSVELLLELRDFAHYVAREHCRVV